jgi:hypothetical protein
MVGYQIALRLDDEALAELDRPDGRFRGVHGNASMPDALTSEFTALLESLNVPSDGIRMLCWLDGDRGVTARQEFSNAMRASVRLELETRELLSSVIALHDRCEKLEVRAESAEAGGSAAAGMVKVLLPLVERAYHGPGLTRADVAAAFTAADWAAENVEALFRRLTRPERKENEP